MSRSSALAAICLSSGLLVSACGPSGGASKTAVEAMSSPAEKQAALASLPAPYNTGDLENGERQFGVCRSCHTIAPGGRNMTGPNLYGVFGRKAGSVDGFAYSDAVKAAGFVWDGAHLDQWLTNPRTFLPGTKMSFAGIKAEKDRVDLIAYLKVETGAGKTAVAEPKTQP
ncbi:MAG: cytochrome c family protein [Phenylobacterium sp.]|uniref:c-type cytochrome n=1 Tax=Phenylobacterium sp. TaxID=1871053 RepID=UPI0027338733|nr:cytochrome c family protein [Phenylobacterium sp.]MDP3174411.1 cytochrome c family protein [Phenylobacterium sp.]